MFQYAAATWIRGGLRHAKPAVLRDCSQLHTFQNSVTLMRRMQAVEGDASTSTCLQIRAHSALPQPACHISDDDSGSDIRNLKLGVPETRVRSAQQSEERLRQRHNSVLPTAEEVRKALKSGSDLDCGSGTHNTAASTKQQPLQQQQYSQVSWRDAVRAFRNADPPHSRAVLTDTHERRHSYLRISLTERCNLRCVYCMPENGVDLTPSAELLTTQEILRLAGIFATEGVTKIRLTGGEPTVRKDIVTLTAQLAAIPGIQSIGMTTNGIALQRKLAALQTNGLSLLNISLDTLREERFESMTRRRGLSRVLDTIHQAVDLGFDPVKVNVVVMRGQNDDEVLDFVEMTRDVPINIRFIEYMPFDGNVWSNNKMVPYAELAERINGRYFPGLQRLQDPKGEVAMNFRIPGFAGTVSFVASMSKAFCGDCNRLRLMADGNLKVCLFGANEVSLRDAMREGASDFELGTVISAAVDRKKAAHAGMFAIAATPNRSMVKIGG